MYKLKYSVAAEYDLHDTIEYIAQESIKNAKEYLKGYEKKVELLQLNPYMGVECKSKDIQYDCRVLVYQRHIIIYQVLEEAEELFIIRIYRSSEDYIYKFSSQ